MANEKWKTKYEQLNQRSRWYSSALWHVPFTYLGLAGYGSVKIVDMDYPLNSFGFILLAIFSISVFVHLSHLKFYELRAVRSLQKLEENGEVLSTGAARWYLSFSFYIRFMLCIASYFFITFGVLLVKMGHIERCITLSIGLPGLTFLYGIIIWEDIKRNSNVIREIREASKLEQPESQHHDNSTNKKEDTNT